MCLPDPWSGGIRHPIPRGRGRGPCTYGAGVLVDPAVPLKGQGTGQHGIWGLVAVMP